MFITSSTVSSSRSAAFGDVLRLQSQYALGRITSDGLQPLDDPWVDFVAELSEEYVLIILSLVFLRHLTPYLDFAVNKHSCELDVASALTDTLLHLVRKHEYLDLVVLVRTHVDR